MATLKAGTTIGSLTPITSGNISTQSVTYATTAGSAPANGGTSAACSGNAATATYATTVAAATDLVYGGLKVSLVDTTLTITI